MEIINEVNSILITSTKFSYKIYDIHIVYTQSLKPEIVIADVEIKWLSNDQYQLLSTNNTNYMTKHILRIIKNKFNTDIFGIDQSYDVFDSIIKILLNPYIFCTISGKSIDFIGEKITSKPEFMKEFCELVTDNIISDSIKRDIYVVYFLIKTAIYAINSHIADKVYNPRLNNINIDELKKLISSKRLEEIIQDISNNLNKYMNDYDIYMKLEKELYAFVKFTILSNKTYIVSEKIDKLNDSFSLEQDKLDNNSFNKTMNFCVVHDEETEKIFDNEKKPFFVFHGSHIGNWYSIMRNGLKNYSNTDMMVNGAAYGPGIYLANTIEMAYGYSHKTRVPYNDMNTHLIVGVGQLLDKDMYDKKNGIFVASDENKLLLRNIALVNRTNCKQLQSYYDKLSVDIYNISNLKFQIFAKRISSECEKITKFIKKNNNDNIMIKYDVESHNIWKLFVHKNNNNIIFNILFGKRYPIEPPIIILLETNCENILNVTQKINKQIKLKELDDNTWNIRNDIRYVISLIIDKL